METKRTVAAGPWFSIKLKKGVKEKNAPMYAAKSRCEGYVLLSNGAYVAFSLTEEECRQRYEITGKLSPENSDRIDNRYNWEMGR